MTDQTVGCLSFYMHFQVPKTCTPMLDSIVITGVVFGATPGSPVAFVIAPAFVWPHRSVTREGLASLRTVKD